MVRNEGTTVITRRPIIFQAPRPLFLPPAQTSPGHKEMVNEHEGEQVMADSDQRQIWESVSENWAVQKKEITVNF